MKQVYLPVLFEFVSELGRLGEVYKTLRPEDYKEPNRTNNKRAFADHTARLEELDLRMCAQMCNRIADEMGTNTPTQLVAQMNALLERLYDECRLRKFMALSEKQAGFAFPEKPLFGGDVDLKYPTAAFEIEEAGKCLGLNRHTAAVFHCMRVMEIGIASVSKCLGIPDPIKPAERNWGVMLRKFKEEIERRDKAGAWGGDKTFFEEAYASLDAVRNPWRNATMHVENKYNDEEAEHIFTAVKAFMRKLASRLDEKGEPKCP